jgi:hypothetical protein
MLKPSKLMMTPELKVACEVVFQEHKASHHSVTWNRDAFLGRLSTGLTEMAKDTLLRRKIIYYPNPSKKMITLLSPQAEHASSFEEAERMINSQVPVLYPAASEHAGAAMKVEPAKTYISKPVIVQRFTTLAERTTVVADARWYKQPLFYYFVWPVCAAVAGMVIAHYIGALYTEIFFDLK